MRAKIFLVIVIFSSSSLWAVAQDTKENADFKLAVNLYNDKLYDLALEQFRQFINLYPATQQGIEARFYLGLAQSKLGKYDDARITFQAFALAYPENSKAPEAWMNVAESYVALNNLREAALAYERVKTFHPKSKFAPSALLKASEYFERIGDKESAKKTLRSLTQDYSSSDVLPARLKLAEMYSSESEFESARQECKRVVDATKEAPLKARALLMMAQALLKMDRNKEAETSLNEIITNLRSTSSYHGALLTVGLLKKAMGNIAEAMAAWKSVTEDSTKAPKQLRQDAYLELGDALSLGREYARALVEYESAGRIQGARAGEAYYKAAVTAERTSDKKKAGEYYSKAYADSVGKADRRAIVIGAMKAAVSSKSFYDAVQIALKYRDEFPRDRHLPKILIEAAGIEQNELREPQKAVELYEIVLREFPASPLADDALFGLGTALRQAGEYDRAIETLEGIQKRFPSSDFVSRSQEQVRLIQIFDLKSKQSGLEKLALLVGDVIAQKSRGDLAFRLAEIYSHELKDFQQAAQQYRYALSLDLEDAKRPAAWYSLARAFEYLSMKDNANRNALVRQAISAYDSLLKKYPANEFADEAILAEFNLRLQIASNATEARKLGTDFLGQFPNARRKDVAFLSLANSHFASKNYEDAVLMYKLVLEKYPQSESALEAAFQLGFALYTMGEKDSATVLLDQFLAKNPAHARSARAAFVLAQSAVQRGQVQRVLAYSDAIEKKYFYTEFNRNLDLLKGDAYYNAGDFKNAVDFYQRHIRFLQSDFFTIQEIPTDLVYRIAVAFEKIGSRSEARRNYGEYLSRDASSERAGQVYYALSGIARTENNLELAAKYLQEAGRLSPGSIGQSYGVQLETAELLFRNEKYSEAITKYSEVAQLAKGDSLQQYLQSRAIVCYFRLDNIREAEKRAMSFTKTYPTGSQYLAEFEFERGKYSLRKDELDKAKVRFDAVANDYPNAPIVPEALYWVARTYELDEKLPQAVQMYDSILHTYPKSAIIPRAQLSLGNVFYNLEQWDAAAKLFKEICDNEQRSPELVQFAMNNLILTYKELNLYDGALELTRKYLERFPDDPELIDKRIDIGVLYQKLGYYDQSILHLQNLMENGNSDLEGELRYYIGEAYYYKGDPQQAILEFLKVPYLVTKRGKIDWISTSYYMAGQSYEKMSKYEQAITMYKQIIASKDTDTQFKTAAQKEIDRVNVLVGKRN